MSWYSLAFLFSSAYVLLPITTNLAASARLRPSSTSSSSPTSPSPGQTQQAAQVRTESHSPAGLRLKLRILPYLLKSDTVANDFPVCIQVKIMYSSNKAQNSI